MLTKANTDSPGNQSSAYVVWTMSSWSFSCVHAWNESPDLARSPLGVSSPARKASIPSLWLTALAEAAGHPAVGVLQHRDTKRCLETSFGWFHSSHTGTGLDSQAAPTDFWSESSNFYTLLQIFCMELGEIHDRQGKTTQTFSVL